MTGIDPQLRNFLALDRSWLASERTLMAWIRTALALISFGFTIYKFLQFVRLQSEIDVTWSETPRNVGLTLIGLGTAAIVVGSIQHWKYAGKLNALHPEKPYKPIGLSMIFAFLLALLGLLMFWSIILRAGPLG